METSGPYGSTMPRITRILTPLSILGAAGATANAKVELDNVRAASDQVDALLQRIAHTTERPVGTRRAA